MFKGKRRVLDENRRKIILYVAGAILLIAIIVVIYLSLTKNKQTSSTATPTPQSSGSYTGYTPPPNSSGIDYTGPTNGITATPIGSVTPGTSASKTPISSTISQTPTATSIQTDPKLDQLIAKDPILKNIPRSAFIAVTPYPNSGPLDWTRNTQFYIDTNKLTAPLPTPCEAVGLSDNWDNPIEKFACDSINFFDTKVTNLISQAECYMTIAQYQVNIESSIGGKYENGFCKVEQR